MTWVLLKKESGLEEDEMHKNCLSRDIKGLDYAKICFELSRADDSKFTCEVERAWIGDLAKYIVELENEIFFSKGNKCE